MQPAVFLQLPSRCLAENQEELQQGEQNTDAVREIGKGARACPHPGPVAGLPGKEVLTGLGAGGPGSPSSMLCVLHRLSRPSLSGPWFAHLYDGRLGDLSPAPPTPRTGATAGCSAHAQLPLKASTYLLPLFPLFPKPIRSNFHLLSPKGTWLCPFYRARKAQGQEKTCPNLSTRKRWRQDLNPGPDSNPSSCAARTFLPGLGSPRRPPPPSLALPLPCFLPVPRPGLSLDSPEATSGL